jgi:Fuc2NAc and GlcNAc transferase
MLLASFPMITPTIVTFILSLIIVNLIRRHLKRHLIDIPNDRSSHKYPTPRGGGLGFIIVFAIGLLFSQFRPSSTEMTIAPQLWLSLLPLIFISLLDDWKSLRATVRYPVQLFVSMLIVSQTGAFPQPWLQQLGIPGHILATALTIVGITALINFYNFMDGLDGLVAGVSLVQVTFCAMMLHQPILWLLAGALLGFLVWNWSPAKIFMGDAGSTVLGAVLAIVLLQDATTSPAYAWTNLAITLPLIGDAIYTLGRRALRHENIFQAHRTHLYQRLHQAGWNHASVASLYIGATLLVAASLATLGFLGAGLSLLASIVGIFQVENYLQRVSLLKPPNLPVLDAMGFAALLDQRGKPQQDRL